MNILFTCAGRRNYLIEYFRAALCSHGMIYAVDSTTYASALLEADKGFLVPPIDNHNYIKILVKLCRDYKVDILISLNDLELLLLAGHRKEFTDVGTLPLVSSKEVIDICFDKWRTILFCKEHGLKAPASYLEFNDAKKAIKNGEIDYPLVLKPRSGSASICMQYVYDDDELDFAYKLVEKRISRTSLSRINHVNNEHLILIQEKLKGQEYGLDVINDLRGQHRAVFVKQKIAMRDGETDKAITIDDPYLTKIGRTIAENLKHIGNLDCDIFVDRQEVYLLDMNPRFGGGYPFSHFAGANLPAALIAWAKGEEVNPEWLKVRPGVFSTKCARLVGRESPDRIERFD